MGRSAGGTLYTLAQFARRAGISEGRARALYATTTADKATPSRLPRPDRTDADGRPLWWAATIDTWCARTGRAVNEDSAWLLRRPTAASPAVELRRGVVKLVGPYSSPMTLYAIVWDTPHGHVIYLAQLVDGHPLHPDTDLAIYAAELIEPRWWSTAVVVMPLKQHLGSPMGWDLVADVYRLTTEAAESTDDESAHGVARNNVSGGLLRWLTRAGTEVHDATKELGAEPCPQSHYLGQMGLSEIAAAAGHQIPVWLAGTESVAAAEQTLSYDRTFTIADTITGWPATQHQLETALQAEMPATFPAGFAALATAAADNLQTLRREHEDTPSSGPGWYLVCRPARPAPTITLEQHITGVRPVTDLDIVATELAELRTVEAELDIDTPYRDAYYTAVQLLATQLRHAAREAAGGNYNRHTGSSRHPVAAVADDELVSYYAPWDGPVVQAWRKNLTPVPDLGPLLRLRRIRRLLQEATDEQVREAYRDDQGRYILVIETPNDKLWSLAEWPLSLRQTHAWTDATILAADGDGRATTLLALTPADDGTMRTDPVPLPPNGGRGAFAYGYAGGTPATTYEALLRIALDDHPIVGAAIFLVGQYDDDGQPASQLWKTLSRTRGPLRLSWAQIKRWAHADADTARKKQHTCSPS